MSTNTNNTPTTTTTTHTPGPWLRALAFENKDNRPPYNVWNIIGNTDADERKQSIVATTITDDADARLIAAAPELLAALECAVKYLEAHQPKGKIRDIFTQLNEHENAVLKPARAAIAKATGQP